MTCKNMKSTTTILVAIVAIISVSSIPHVFANYENEGINNHIWIRVSSGGHRS